MGEASDVRVGGGGRMDIGKIKRLEYKSEN